LPPSLKSWGNPGSPPQGSFLGGGPRRSEFPKFRGTKSKTICEKVSRVDFFQRAYVFKSTDPKVDKLEFTIDASDASPIQNPAFVVKKWGKRPAALAIDGKDIPRGKDFRFGHNKTLEGTDLVVWVKLSGDKKTSFQLEAPSADDERD
jgi:hypothetical protein